MSLRSVFSLFSQPLRWRPSYPPGSCFFPSRILAVSTLVFALEALYVNLSVILQLPPLRLTNDLVFAGFLFSFAYVAVQKVFSNERRLLSIERELEIARQIQASILPTSVPEVQKLRIAALYQPMTAVGGDFYQFIQRDQSRIGFLVADVAGHGVPAALIASMIKVAMQSVDSCAADPGEVLRRLNRTLSGRFVSAAYLWIDTEMAEALYSAAGHPPLLHWQQAGLQRIESNGLLLGVRAECDYPVCHLPLNCGDRFLLYTDGVVEPENSSGAAFGDSRLEQVLRDNQLLAPLDFSSRLLSEIGNWQPAANTQQDDITFIVVDVV